MIFARHLCVICWVVGLQSICFVVVYLLFVVMDLGYIC